MCGKCVTINSGTTIIFPDQHSCHISFLFIFHFSRKWEKFFVPFPIHKSFLLGITVDLVLLLLNKYRFCPHISFSAFEVYLKQGKVNIEKKKSRTGTLRAFIEAEGAAVLRRKRKRLLLLLPQGATPQIPPKSHLKGPPTLGNRESKRGNHIPSTCRD